MRVAREVLEAIVSHARAAAPDECCGLLVGTAESIDRAVPARNLRPGPSRYLVDPADHIAAIRLARAAGQVVCGAYHSHPRGPATPSETDLAEAHDSRLVHIIVSLEAGREGTGAYRLDRDGYTPVELETV